MSPENVVNQLVIATVAGTQASALTERLTGGLSYSYVNAEFVQLDDPEALNLFGNASVAGKHPAGVPASQASVFGRYGFDLGTESRGFVRAGRTVHRGLALGGQARLGAVFGA